MIAKSRANENQRKPKYTLKSNRALPKFERSVSLLCWAYNEENLIGPYLERINQLLSEAVEDYEIVVIDDGSTDATNDVVRRMQTQIPQIKLYRNEKNMDVGYSSRRAIRLAVKEYLFWQTIDWSYNITMFRTFLELLKTYDVVAGVRRAPVQRANRYIKPLKGFLNLFGIEHMTKRSDSPFRAFISITNYLLIRLLFQMPLSDFQNIVFYPTKLVQSLNFEANSSFANPELLLKAYWQGASIIEAPISFLPRQAGKAKGARPKAIKASITDISRLWFKWILLGRRGSVKKGTITRLDPSEWEIL